MENIKECQSCAMQMTKLEDFGTESTGNTSADYCCHCYQKGDFTWKPPFEEFIESNLRFWDKEEGESDDDFRIRVETEIGNLKRWK